MTEELEDKVARRMTALGAEPRKMFGGTCFMLRGHMVLGTSKRGLLVRIGKAGDALAAASKAARPMEMRGKPLAGYWFIDPEALREDAELAEWIDLALACNIALDEKPTPKPRGPGRKKTPTG